MSAVMRGWFCFRLLENGDISGEWGNTDTDGVGAENAVRVLNAKAGEEVPVTDFSGRYHSTWKDHITKDPVFAILEISKKNEFGKYELLWREPTRRLFKGEGMLASNGCLVGYYEYT